MEWDAIVVGGGPTGCFTAEHISKQGFKVLILEKNHIIGEPLQCSGLVSQRTVELAECENLILNRLNGANIYSPDGKSITISGTRPYAFAIERSLLDQQLAQRAQKAGANLLLSARVINLHRYGKGIIVEFIRNGCTFKATTKLVIGADGVNSIIAKWAGLYQPSENIKMFAAEVNLRNSFTEMVDIFVGNCIAPGWFGWIIPIDDKAARIGTGSSYKHISIKTISKSFLSVYKHRFSGIKIIKETSGLVPIGIVKNYASNIMLVGDAACQTKPISGGGLYFGLTGAKISSEVAVEALKSENYSSSFLCKYQMQWDKKMREQLEKAIKYRYIYQNLSDFQLNILIKALNNGYWHSHILDYLDIDYPPIIVEKFLRKCSLLFLQKLVKPEIENSKLERGNAYES